MHPPREAVAFVPLLLFPGSAQRAKRVLDKKPEAGGADFEDFQGGQGYSRELVAYKCSRVARIELKGF